MSLFISISLMPCFFQAVNRFTLLADESHEVPTLRNKSYSDFKLDRADWKKIRLVHNVLKVFDLFIYSFIYLQLS